MAKHVIALELLWTIEKISLLFWRELQANFLENWEGEKEGFIESFHEDLKDVRQLDPRVGPILAIGNKSFLLCAGDIKRTIL